MYYQDRVPQHSPHLARLLKRQGPGEPRISKEQIFVAFSCQVDNRFNELGAIMFAARYLLPQRS